MERLASKMKEAIALGTQMARIGNDLDLNPLYVSKTMPKDDEQDGVPGLPPMDDPMDDFGSAAGMDYDLQAAMEASVHDR